MVREAGLKAGQAQRSFLKGAAQQKGASLGAWVEFLKTEGKIPVLGCAEGREKKGS